MKAVMNLNFREDSRFINKYVFLRSELQNFPIKIFSRIPKIFQHVKITYLNGLLRLTAYRFDISFAWFQRLVRWKSLADSVTRIDCN